MNTEEEIQHLLNSIEKELLVLSGGKSSKGKDQRIAFLLTIRKALEFDRQDRFPRQKRV